MAGKDASRVEAAKAGGHTEHEEHGAHGHVGAHDAAHGDDHGGGHGHGADPNEGVLRGEQMTPAWLLTVAGITVLTAVLCVLLAIKIG